MSEEGFVKWVGAVDSFHPTQHAYIYTLSMQGALGSWVEGQHWRTDDFDRVSLEQMDHIKRT